jgi:hypothetical protein
MNHIIGSNNFFFSSFPFFFSLILFSERVLQEKEGEEGGEKKNPKPIYLDIFLMKFLNKPKNIQRWISWFPYR